MKLPRLKIIALLLTSFAFLSPVSGLGEEPSRRATSFFNAQWLDTVVSIEVKKEGTDRPVGTGFLVKTEGNHLLLVTAKHVIADETGKTRPNLEYRLNESSGGTVLLNDEEIEHHNAGPWFLSPESDVACRFLVWHGSPKFKWLHSQIFLSHKEVKAGARLLVLGFPLGLRSPMYANPIARQGMVARSDSEGIVIDSFVFPGNSGGPVIYSPPLKLGGGLESNLINEERLIGLISSFIPYVDVAYSQQTLRPRISFEENSGLANVIPADKILELIQRGDVQERDKTLTRSEESH